VTVAPEAEAVEEIVPQIAGLQAPEPDDKAQVTPLPLSFATVAVNVVVLPACMETVAGETATEIAGPGDGGGASEDLLPETAAQPPKNIAATRNIRADKALVLPDTRPEELSFKASFS
jgi:hypothetical protein